MSNSPLFNAPAERSLNARRPPFAAPWLGRLLDVLLPQNCALCGQAAGREAVCTACLGELPRHADGVCPRCGDVSASGDPCGHCLRQPPHFDATLAAFAYAFPVDRLVQRFKYAGHLHLARWWAARLAETLATAPVAPLPGRPAGRHFDLLVPMPLHRSRLAERGFNQAVEIGRHLSSASGIPMRVDTCARTRATPPQAELERDQRLKNVHGAFECRDDLSGLHLLLVDDVMTTAASMNELARIVKLHGAASATALVAARTLHA